MAGSELRPSSDSRRSDREFTLAVIIAMTVLIVIAVAVMSISKTDLTGFWLEDLSRVDAACGAGSHLYEINSRVDSIRDIEVLTHTAGARHGLTSAGNVNLGRIYGIRSVAIPGLSKIGTLEFGGRRLLWRDGTAWTRQGIRSTA